MNEAPARRRAPAWLRDPLVAFLALGGLFYAAHALFAPDGGRSGDDHVIVVDRARLLEHLQYRAKAFAPELFDARLSAMDAAARRALVDEIVQEEVMAREAASRHLAEGDDVIRQRMIQRLGFLLEAPPAGEAAPDDAQLQAFLEAHAADYREPASYSFAQVFLDAERRGQEGARAAARTLLPRLRARHVAFNDAMAEGDRFPWTPVFVERTRDYVEAQLGPRFGAALEGVEVGEWQGPLDSTLGSHLVLLVKRSPPRVPALAEIRQRVLEDWQRERATAAREAAVRQLVAGYEVRLAPDLGVP